MSGIGKWRAKIILHAICVCVRLYAVRRVSYALTPHCDNYTDNLVVRVCILCFIDFIHLHSFARSLLLCTLHCPLLQLLFIVKHSGTDKWQCSNVENVFKRMENNKLNDEEDEKVLR